MRNYLKTLLEYSFWEKLFTVICVLGLAWAIREFIVDIMSLQTKSFTLFCDGILVLVWVFNTATNLYFAPKMIMERKAWEAELAKLDDERDQMVRRLWGRD